MYWKLPGGQGKRVKEKYKCQCCLVYESSTLSEVSYAIKMGLTATEREIPSKGEVEVKMSNIEEDHTEVSAKFYLL